MARPGNGQSSATKCHSAHDEVAQYQALLTGAIGQAAQEGRNKVPGPRTAVVVLGAPRHNCEPDTVVIIADAQLTVPNPSEAMTPAVGASSAAGTPGV